MSWNYRVVKDGDTFAIHEAYYNEDGDVWGITENPTEPSGGSRKDLKKDLKWMRKALKQPIIDLETWIPAPPPGCFLSF